ncbi:glycoside hydrolase family 28 protein [Teratosphaeria destructans]|uniref:Glycoside hydrolase family 28 protein n=1 Tax=Teratosphaeria destructans TaxID=418781 RepID=A0A9W7SUD6_9PEZI|nr:glycoside hydrolase family 28 protein [Teratosphaeria destructans]
MWATALLGVCSMLLTPVASHLPKPHAPHSRHTCIVAAQNDSSIDDAPAIVSAFKRCGHDGHIIFRNTTYHINSPLNTTGLSDVHIDIRGTLLWSNDTDYWLNHSMPIGYQNQSTVWFLGGDRLVVKGHGVGTFKGNGPVWYNCCSTSNYPHRPQALNIRHTTDSYFSGINFFQSQMWTMTVQFSSHVVLEDIYVDNTYDGGKVSPNTDGVDTLYSDDITFRRWTVHNGDDAISTKANSTNILIEDCTFYRGLGLAFGSIGQYPGVYERIENVTARNITGIGTKYAGYIKTWYVVPPPRSRVDTDTTDAQDRSRSELLKPPPHLLSALPDPPNGGGGGLGYMKNITIRDVYLDDARAEPFSISQCTSYSGAKNRSCETSQFKISDITVANVRGTVKSDVVAVMQCSAAAGGCDDIAIEDVVVENTNRTAHASCPNAWQYQCDNVNHPVGFSCTGEVSKNPGGS